MARKDPTQIAAIDGRPLGMINADDAHRISETLRFFGKNKPNGPLSRARIDRMMGKARDESDFERKCRLFGVSPATVKSGKARQRAR